MNKKYSMYVNKNNKTVKIKDMKMELSYEEFSEIRDFFNSIELPKEETHIKIEGVKGIGKWIPRYGIFKKTKV